MCISTPLCVPHQYTHRGPLNTVQGHAIYAVCISLRLLFAFPLWHWALSLFQHLLFIQRVLRVIRPILRVIRPNWEVKDKP